MRLHSLAAAAVAPAIIIMTFGIAEPPPRPRHRRRPTEHRPSGAPDAPSSSFRTAAAAATNAVGKRSSPDYWSRSASTCGC